MVCLLIEQLHHNVVFVSHYRHCLSLFVDTCTHLLHHLCHVCSSFRAVSHWRERFVERSRSSFGVSVHANANCSRTVRVVRSVKCNSREQLVNEANNYFRLIFYLLIPAGRKLHLKSKQYAGLNSVFSQIFAISLGIPSQSMLVSQQFLD